MFPLLTRLQRDSLVELRRGVDRMSDTEVPADTAYNLRELCHLIVRVCEAFGIKGDS